MKVLLTGANGFIGSFLAQKLVEKKYEVRCLVRSSSNLRWIADLNTEIAYGNLSDKKSLKNAIKGVDYIFHLAGVTKAPDNRLYNKGNFEGTKNLIDTIIENGFRLKRFIFSSSQAAYGPSASFEPVNEENQRNPLTDYGRSKLKAHEYVESVKNKIPVTIVIPPAVYGPRDTDVLEFFKTVKIGIIPQLDGKDKYASIIHVSDLTDGIIMAAESSGTIGGSYFLANPKPVAWSEIARVILDQLGKRAIRVNIPFPIVNGFATVTEMYSKLTQKPNIISRQKLLEMKQDFWICSSQKAKKDFGFESKIDLEEGIKDTLAWYVTNNWL
ncbi:MAG: NAD-dependent epimerase/dehydratase family protein [Calditrichae bacterium]|nr:NAD-dependent epimerase/dehydratase family protein [Calditrichota bacterium]MCB9058211.1 NAD-dependent epimerase/dehydratase family protein [Calditrichia bacterium]